MKDLNQYYINGWYSMPIPGSGGALWNQADWIRWVDNEGIWQKPDLKARYKQAVKAVIDGLYNPVDAAKQYDVSPAILSHGVEFFKLGAN
jgi:hypothetical protein